MKVFSRAQLREAYEDWKPAFRQDGFSREWKIAVDDFLTFVDTYQFKGESMSVANRATGKVKWFNSKKGFGFIVPDEGGNDVFVHATDLDANLVLHDGDKVEFDVVSTKRGIKAIDVVLL